MDRIVVACGGECILTMPVPPIGSRYGGRPVMDGEAHDLKAPNCCGPATVAASALTGVITHPGRFMLEEAA